VQAVFLARFRPCRWLAANDQSGTDPSVGLPRASTCGWAA
jgi:hypothetical protein